jgi:hypothetical protein
MKLTLTLASKALAATALIVAAPYLGCATVPDIRFVADDAGGTAGADAATTTDGATTDGAPTDGSTTADGPTAIDAAPACTTASPAGGAMCCGAVWCIGDCSTTNCDQCANRGCATTDFCCGKMGTVVCKTRCP